MSVKSPLGQDEIAFAVRLLFETLHFAEPIQKTAEPKFRKLGFTNGAIENVLRVMDIAGPEYRSKMYSLYEPASVEVCPWESRAAFLERNAELRDWIVRHGGQPADIGCFICPEPAQ
ncbi:MAG: hypothetical protein FJ308_18335 [Planctomycetes bacterium]|nr:hypothetical protein [Planctomycetota bacterium]